MRREWLEMEGPGGVGGGKRKKLKHEPAGTPGLDFPVDFFPFFSLPSFSRFLCACGVEVLIDHVFETQILPAEPFELIDFLPLLENQTFDRYGSCRKEGNHCRTGPSSIEATEHR